MRLPPSRATAALAGITTLAHLIVTVTGSIEYAAIAGGFIPARFSGLDLVGAVPAWATPLSATLLHGGILHLVMNLIMLGYCGRFVEVPLGGRGLLLLYVIGAYAAALFQYFANPGDTTPMIGASGAISAVVGAYALLYGKQRAAVSHERLNLLIHIAWLAAAWIGLQLLIGIATTTGGLGIAIAAHIGGFLAGLALALPLLRWRYRGA
jgi:membrane associated rhomboid family serine protease